MLEYIDAPMPFIMGVPKHLWKKIKEQRDNIPSDIIVLDIDKNKLMYNEQLPELPPKAAESVYSVILSIIDEREKLRKTYKHSKEYERKVKEYWVSGTLRLKQSFLNMFFCLVNNYLICYKKNVENGLLAKDIFDFEQYLSFFDEESKEFMKELCKTQGFQNFIEQSYRAKEEKNDTLFFKEGVRLCSEKGNKELAMQVKKIAEQLILNNKTVMHIIKL